MGQPDVNHSNVFVLFHQSSGLCNLMSMGLVIQDFQQAKTHDFPLAFVAK